MTKRLEEIEQLLFQCEEDLKRLQDIHREIKKIELNCKKLDKYYNSQYMQDFDNQNTFDRDYAMLDEDSIWNVLTGLHCERIALIKTLVKAM
ncbi:DUF4298 domain-containing protein [Pasteurella skyensis]|uniref:DUF4298 domain-containing protein n=1 Tax=Phocoenobacter skyensis TaxID=97481 RepID=A0AAJ6NBS2_9PAST|nr:DUF4298 domain-containing protein [Pasteurella skyensis]MDP8162317.1 DUF4298 domain-containing protein [Pasteurella skyensis]MDP8171096.1 DUF4298 domain-containing protein [Pasteurella skyensis]MDP8172349.1 DUF4298 domain-containing protein [Pasteurella skyensis]MDP8173873.1 DUF4298 domain-containing protein [Pasteurella skyensis]MDP8177019.1 DUF4298 domain-containing protein [Pasteurella skyensis]